METDSSIPVRNQFSGMFDKFGDEVWDKWDDFLKNAEVDGKSKTGIMKYLLLIGKQKRLVIFRRQTKVCHGHFLTTRMDIQYCQPQTGSPCVRSRTLCGPS
jgi:hypothetical protein